MRRYCRRVGNRGENFAAGILEDSGYMILERNYRSRSGEEIDIIATKDGVLHFIEVKTRQNLKYGRPCEAVTEEKKKHLRRAAHCFMDEMKGKGCTPRCYSFQIIEILVNQIDHAF